MAVTRIKNNQITDSTVNAAAKLQDYSITGGKISNNLTYGSSLTVTGNLTVQGNTTTISTVDLQVEDPIIVLADEQTGSPALDIGYIGKRGTSSSIAFVWQESTSEFVTAFTNSASTNSTITISSYANLKSQNIYANGHISSDGNLTVGGRSFLGNILVYPSSNVDIGNNRVTNVATPSAGSDAATKDYVDGIASSGFTIEDDSANTTVVSGGDTLVLNGTSNEVTVAITGADEVTFGLPDSVTVTANLSSGNVLTGGVVSATGNVTGGNLITGGLIASTGNITGGNLITGGVVNATGNVSGGNVISAALVQGVTVSASGNVIGGNVTTGGLVSATGNVNGGNLISSALVEGVTVSASGNVVGGNANITSAVNSATMSASGNITGGNVLTGGVVSSTGNITGGNLITAGLVQGLTVSATANVIAGNVTTAGLVSATGNVTGGNLITGGDVSATGNVNGGNVNTGTVKNTAAMTIVTTTGNINIEPAGNIVLNNTYINGVNQPVQDNDAASKIYVDNMVSTQLSYHEAVVAATTGTLATATGGTVSYDNGASGVGAKLTTTGAFNLIDTANVQTVGTRILIKNEANAAWNGIYQYANTTAIVRTSDADSYGPNAADHLSINDYFFVSSGDVNKGSAWICDEPTGTITFGVSNIAFAQFSSSQTYTAGNGISLVGTVITAKVDNNTTAFDGLGNIVVKASANLTTPNIGEATGTSVSLTGTATAGNVLTGGVVSATGTITGGNLATGGTSSATGNVTGGNLITGGAVFATGNVNTSANLVASGYATVTGNITGGNLLTSGELSSTGNVTGGNLITAGLVQGATVSASGNLVGGNANITSAVNSATMSATGNITGGNVLTGGVVSATGNLTGGNVNTGGIVNATGNLVTGANLVASGYATVTGNVTGGNVLTGGVVSATGNLVTSANLVASGYATVTGNIDGGNLATAGLITATGNITGGNVLTGGVVSATGNIDGGNLRTGGLITATGNITGGNITSSGQANLGNIRISGDNITDTNGRVNFNSAQGAVDFAVNGGAANVFYISASGNSASFGNSTQVTNAIAAFQTTTSIRIPVGSTAERPGTGVTGMVRFNTSVNNLEFYDANSWQTAGSQFTVITANTQNGDGTKVDFTLPVNGTTAGTIVSINGVVQIPITAYSISGNTCTFTEAPASTDVIDFRELSTTSSVTAIAGLSGAYVQASDTATEIQILGNLNPVGNLAYTLGNATNFWKSLYVGGNSIYLGSLILKDAGSNTFAVYTSDGTTQANLDVGTIDVSSINSGTSVIGISGTNGNAYITVGGTANVLVASTTGVAVTGTLSSTSSLTVDGGAFGNVVTTPFASVFATGAGGNPYSIMQVRSNDGTSGMGIQAYANLNSKIYSNSGFSFVTGATLRDKDYSTGGTNRATLDSTGLAVTGIVSASGNITGSYILGNGSQLTGIDATSIQSGTSNVKVVSSGGNVTTSVGGTANVVVVTTTGANIAGTLSASGNITGGNVAGATGAFTNISGTLTTAAQTNITSVGTLSSLAVAGNISPGGIAMSTGNATIGNLYVSGNTTIAGNITQISGNSGQFFGNASTGFNALYAGLPAGFTLLPQSVVNFVSQYDDYSQINNQNQSAGNTATADWVLTSNNGTDATYYADFGIASSNYNGAVAILNNAMGNSVTPNDAYLYVTGNVAAGNPSDLVLAAVDIGGQIRFAVAGSTVANVAMKLNAPNTTSSSTTTGTAVITGGLGVSGNITSANLSVGTGTITGGNIVNSNANGVGNIGSSSTYFNTVFAKATSAQYADLAEKYEADAEYAPGTVLEFGGAKEVTLSVEAGSTRVAGVVSTNPSYIMNAGLTAEHVAMVALQGRVPCRVIGPVRKGDMMVAAGNGAAKVDNAARAGSIIGKSLENFDGAEGTIEVVIGRN